MSSLESSIEVEAPILAAYGAWARVEDLPRFVGEVESVRWTEPRHVLGTSRVGRKKVEWEAEIWQQEPGRFFAWRSTSGARNSGAISFTSLEPGRTRVDVRVHFEPYAIAETVGDALSLVSQRVESALDLFKRLVETGADAPRLLPPVEPADAAVACAQASPGAA
jgi:uncharacterized membrane protein